ncbi:MAG: helix-turn-helix transcriptional regulator [Firmicutes bacterium]|nr:helix-turn-helix transcriptional regulator [Bacillota bacterium]
MNQVKIGKFITECRKNKKVTQEELAEKLGVTSKSISRWENGKTMPDYSLLKDLCNELGISVNELLSGEKIEQINYINKAEENFILLKKKVDDTLKFLDIISIICFVIIVVLFFVHMYFNWLYRDAWDDSIFKSISNNILYFSLFCGIISNMLKYEVKK